MSRQRPAVPPLLDRVVARSLEKDPDNRWQTAADMLATVRWTSDGVSGESTVRPRPEVLRAESQSKQWLMPILAAALFVMSIALGVMMLRTVETPVSTRFIFTPPGPVNLGQNLSLALSPDGSKLTYVSRSENTTQLYLREMGEFETRPIPGTEGGTQPFFSPDAEWVGFFAEGRLNRVSLAGGPAITVSDVEEPRGGEWAPDDMIYFGSRRGLMRVPATGGTLEPAATLLLGEGGHYLPQILPDENTVIFTSFNSGKYSVVAQSLADIEKRQVILPEGRDARYLPTGHLLYATEIGSLFAMPFDPGQLKIAGTEVPVLDGIALFGLGGAAQFDVSASGTLAYIPNAELQALTTLIWMDTDKQAIPLPGLPLPHFEHPRLSPDGRRLAISTREGNPDIWSYELERGTATRVTYDTGDDETPVWTPDGDWITYRRGQQILMKAPDGSGYPIELTTLEEKQFHLGGWSPDGSVLTLNVDDQGTDIWGYRPAGNRPPEPMLQTPFDELAPSISPNGNWVAYSSDEAGNRHEVYVAAFPSFTDDQRITTEGGREPVWARSGRELFFRTGDRLMAVGVRQEPDFGVVSSPRLVFDEQLAEGHRNYPNYDVDVGDSRFLMIREEEQTTPTHIHITLNWVEELKERVPVR